MLQNSIFRLFFDTSESGVLVKYRLFDYQNQELLTSVGEAAADADGFMGSATEIDVLHQPEHMDPFDNPYTLMLEYKYSPHGGKNHEISSSCP